MKDLDKRIRTRENSVFGHISHSVALPFLFLPDPCGFLNPLTKKQQQQKNKNGMQEKFFNFVSVLKKACTFLIYNGLLLDKIITNRVCISITYMIISTNKPMQHAAWTETCRPTIVGPPFSFGESRLKLSQLVCQYAS